MRFDQIRVGSSPIAGVLVRIGKFGQRDANTEEVLWREMQGEYCVMATLRCIYKPGDAKDCWQTPEIRNRQRMIPF